MSYFPELYSHRRKAEVDCSDYATKCINYAQIGKLSNVAIKNDVKQN